MKSDVLTIYYDGYCPLCCAEMDSLKRYDRSNLIKLVNVHQDDFSTKYPHINKAAALRILHGEYRGKVLLALDVTHLAWTIIGKGVYVAPLKFPVIKQFSHFCYLLVAKYRHTISSFLHCSFGIGKVHCENGTCNKTSNIDRWRK